ncbi:ankyrin repeat-containing protein ITN1-like isoform X2 [Oryza brachyantha]|nr:ankyrin repeat-containing protein ITN1-like isoform X2 [Oryza brachyantha]
MDHFAGAHSFSSERMSASIATTSSPGTRMERRLLEAAMAGNARSMKEMAAQNPSLLLGTTPQGNTCLHISSIHGHEGFCKDVLMLNNSLLTVANMDGETPLLTAVTSGQTPLASVLLEFCQTLGFSEAILRQDKNGCNVLHHAIRNGHKDLALEFIEKEHALSQAVNKYNESPMFIAVMKDFTDVSEKLLEIPESSHVGTYGHNALHATVRNGNAVIAKKIVEARPWLSRQQTRDGKTPILLTVLWDKIDVLRVLLEHDVFLGYEASNNVAAPLSPLLVAAAYRGHVDVAQELLDHCPDAPYCDKNGWTCLHQAVNEGQTEFVEFILRAPQLRKVINMQNNKDGQTALHQAVRMCNPKIVALLLLHKDTDFTLYDHKGGQSVIWQLWRASQHAKTLNWNEVSMLMIQADPEAATTLHRQVAKKRVTDESTKDVRSLTQTYTSNTSLVAILIATITFAAAFTLPGGYSNDSGSEGLPVMARKLAFQAFLVSDTMAMCSSLAVAFVCILARWEDLEFLLYYRSFTKNLMWFAYMATTIAFATGLYTVLAPRILWLAVAICFLSVLLPILTKLLGEWPVLKLRFRLGRTFKSDLLDMV